MSKEINEWKNKKKMQSKKISQKVAKCVYYASREGDNENIERQPEKIGKTKRQMNVQW